MRKILLLLILLLSVEVYATQKIKNPQIDFSPTWVKIHEIELGKDATIIHCDLQNKPNWWVKVQSNWIIQDKKSGKNYKILRVDGIEIDKEIYMPESGKMPCTIYFEPLDKSTELINIIEPGGRVESQVYGVHLKSVKQKKDKDKFDPRSMNADYYINLPYKADTTWRFSTERYKDMKFYKPGKAHLTVHLDNLVDELKSSFENCGILSQDLILNRDNNQTAKLIDNKCWEQDIDLTGPQFVSITGAIYLNIFMQPGDTLDIYTTLETDINTDKPKYMTFKGNSESAIINSLFPVLLKKIGIADNTSFYKNDSKAIENGPESVMALADSYGDDINRIIEGNEVRDLLNSTPLSTYGKDIIFSNAILKIAQNLEDCKSSYDQKRFKQLINADGTYSIKEDSTFIPLDNKRFYSKLLIHKSEIFDNPLSLCTEDRWVLINRFLYSTLIRQYKTEYDSMNRIISSKFVVNPEMKNCFMSDLFYSQGGGNYIKDINKNFELGRIDSQTAIEYMSKDLSESFAEIKYPIIIKCLLKDYGEAVSKVKRIENDNEFKFTGDKQALLDKIIKPYGGNILFLDFWGMGCGPCRQGMLTMRDKVEALKDSPFRFLYICDGNSNSKEGAEKWMNDNNIHGEHIYVTRNEWNLLMEMFNFSSIPHAALIGKDGKVIQNDFQIGLTSLDEIKNLIKKYE